MCVQQERPGPSTLGTLTCDLNLDRLCGGDSSARPGTQSVHHGRYSRNRAGSETAPCGEPDIFGVRTSWVQVPLSPSSPPLPPLVICEMGLRAAQVAGEKSRSEKNVSHEMPSGAVLRVMESEYREPTQKGSRPRPPSAAAQVWTPLCHLPAVQVERLTSVL